MDNFTPQIDDNSEGTDRSKLIRKVLIGVLIFVVILGAIFIIFSYLNNKKTPGAGVTFPTTQDVINVIKNVSGSENQTPTETVLSEKANLIELYKGPVAGYTILESSRTVRVFDKSKGLIFDINLNTGDSKAVTEQPILNVYDVLFVGQNTIITRSLDSSGIIKSNLYKFTRSDNNEVLRLEDKPTILADGIVELAKSQNNLYAVIITKDDRGGNVDLYDNSNGKLTRLISLPISEWIPSVSNSGVVFISSKASKYASSGTYKITDGMLDTIVPAKTAQTTILSPDGGLSLSTSIDNNLFSSSISTADKDISSNLKEESSNPLISTLAEKCAWNELGTKIYCGIPNNFGVKTPDEWYLGNISYVDSIWEYNITTSKPSLLIESSVSNVSIDAVSLESNGNILFFKNKKNNHLWGFRLKDDTNINTESDMNVPNDSNNIQNQ